MTKKSFFLFILLLILLSVAAGVIYLGTMETQLPTKDMTITIPNDKFFGTSE